MRNPLADRKRLRLRWLQSTGARPDVAARLEVGGAPTVVDRWYDDDAMSDYIRVREQRAWAFYDNAGGYLIINTAN